MFRRKFLKIGSFLFIGNILKLNAGESKKDIEKFYRISQYLTGTKDLDLQVNSLIYNDVKKDFGQIEFLKILNEKNLSLLVKNNYKFCEMVLLSWYAGKTYHKNKKNNLRSLYVNSLFWKILKINPMGVPKGSDWNKIEG